MKKRLLINRSSILCMLLCIAGTSCTSTPDEKVTLDYALISGRIINTVGEAIPAVNIIAQTSSGTVEAQTSSDGNYTIKMKSGNTSYILFEKEEYQAQSRKVNYEIGEELTLDITLRSIKEDAYLITDVKEAHVSSDSGTFDTYIRSNVPYKIDVASDWIKYDSTYVITIKYEENEATAERTGTIFIRTPYDDLVNKIEIVQAAGPPIKAVDYINKDGSNSYLTTTPYVTFNREAKIISVTSSYSSLDLTCQLSADKTTVTFPNLIIPPLEDVTISYTAEGTDGSKTSGKFNIHAYEYAIAREPFGNYGSYALSKDGRYLWHFVHSDADGLKELAQISTEDMSIKKRFEYNYADLCYNRYNNCIYVIDFTNKLNVLNANTGEVVEVLDIAQKLGISDVTVSNLAFGEHGFGLIRAGSLVYFIDSADDHLCTAFDNSIFADPHHIGGWLIKDLIAFNQGKTLAAVGSSNMFIMDNDTREFTHIKTGVGDLRFTPHYAYPGIFCGSIYSTNGSYLISTGDRIIISFDRYPGPWAAFIEVGEDNPLLLTSSMSLVDIGTKQVKRNFEYKSEVFPLFSSDDGQLIIAGYRKQMLVLKSATFIDFASKLK